MTGHASRQHAAWSASATARNWNCPGALTLTAPLVERRTSEAAAWGTCAHEIAEGCLTQGLDASEFVGNNVGSDGFRFDVDEEMADTAQQFVDYVRGRLADYNAAEFVTSGRWPSAVLYVEQRLSLAAIKPPFEAGGTGDAILWFPGWKLLEIVDLKGGRGVVVEATGNPQMRTYALGAMLTLPDLKPERVMTTIVQPRAPHKDGRIRSETFHVADLLEWTGELLDAMHRAAQADLDAEMGGKDAVWNRRWLNAGDHCKFCPAAGFCPALEQRAMDAVGVWFDDLDKPRISNIPDSMEPSELAKRLDVADLIQEWMNAVRAYAHAQAESGVEIPGYQLVDKIGHRAWKGDDTVTRAALTALGLKPHQLDDVKLKTPAKIEKALGAKRKGEIDALVERPVRGTNLVASDKTTRPAATPVANRFFQPIEEGLFP